MTTLQEMFYNMAVPLKNSPKDQDPWYEHVAETLSEIEADLKESFDENQLYLFKRYKESTSGIDEILAIDYFEQGFRIGVKLMTETLDPQKERINEEDS